MEPLNVSRLSKFLSKVLRHKPELLELELDAQGWADKAVLLAKLQARGIPVTLEDLHALIANSEKQRFALSADGTRIRANQGHSIPIDLGLPPQAPPERLFHGTATRFLASIMAEGLIKGARHHVHLLTDPEKARQVGRRHGKPAVLAVDAAGMHAQGYVFYCSENDVWLTDHVPPAFLRWQP
jgi:putative RNA 2'-phosphotransferase